jgi:hypothetical protein
MKLGKNSSPLGRAERAEIAHDHQDEMIAVIGLEIQVVPVYITNGQLFPGRRFPRMPDRPFREVYAGYGRMSASQSRGI